MSISLVDGFGGVLTGVVVADDGKGDRSSKNGSSELSVIGTLIEDAREGDFDEIEDAFNASISSFSSSLLEWLVGVGSSSEVSIGGAVGATVGVSSNTGSRILVGL